MKIFIYARWSSLEQGRGSTLERQLDLCRRYCNGRGWTDAEVIKDEGRSAYTGANLTQGNLGKLTERLEQGLIPYGSVLIVEQLDRISRRPPMEVMNWISRVVNAGLTIVTANNNQIISKDELEHNQLGIVSIVFDACRGYAESKHKSDRVSDSWRIKREKLERGETIKKSGRCPAWLRLNPVINDFEQILDRVTIVQRIFQLSDAGIGRERIAAILNDERVEPWGVGNSKAEKWHASYIQKIRTNPAVLGEYQPHTKSRSDTKRQPAGEPISDYYPQIIDPVLFARVNRRKPKNAGRKGEISNLFSGLVRCAECGGMVVYRNKASAGAMRRNRKGDAIWKVSSDQTYLACGNYKSETRCRNKHFIRYRPLRDAVLDQVLHLALDDSFFAQAEHVGKIEQHLALKKRERDNLKARASRYLDAMGDDDDPDLRRKWREARAAVRGTEDELRKVERELVDAKGRVSPSEHLKRVASVRAELDDPDPARRLAARYRVMGALGEIVTLMQLMPDRSVRVILLGGAHAMDFDDQGHCLGIVSVLDQIEAGDHQMMRGVSRVELGKDDDENEHEAKRMVEQAIKRRKDLPG
jgi:DNA invertase Pin-like site-specific DNA recombinase